MPNNTKSAKRPGYLRLWLIVLSGLVVLTSGVVILSVQNNQSHVEEINSYDPEYVPGHVVDHRDVVLIEEYLKNHPEVVQAIGETNWFFAHASLGVNILDGMDELHKENPALYPLTIQTLNPSAADPPANVQPGTIYAVNRGNVGVDKKRTTFEKYMEKGWNYQVTAVMNKYSYTDNPLIDSKLDWDGNIASAKDNEARNYLYTMSDLIQTANPDLKVVLTTMPLTAKGASANFMRYAFNQRIREYSGDEELYLFDIADVESHYPDGTADLGVHELTGTSIEQLGALYTTDGGHLNMDGKRQLAKAWYAMAAAIVNSKQ